MYRVANLTLIQKKFSLMDVAHRKKCILNILCVTNLIGANGQRHRAKGLFEGGFQRLKTLSGIVVCDFVR